MCAPQWTQRNLVPPVILLQTCKLTRQMCQTQFNAEGTSLAFLYRVGACPSFYGEYFRTYQFTIDVTGHNLWRVPVAEGSFHDYGAEGRLLVSEKVRCSSTAGALWGYVSRDDVSGH